MSTNISTKLKTIENKLRRDANMSGQIDYNEQIAWMLFLKVLDILEEKQITEAKLSDKNPEIIFDKEYRWSSWAVGDKYTSEERYDFVKNKLLPYLRRINDTPIRRLIAQVFEEIPTKLMKSPYGMSEVLELIDSIDLNNPEDTHIVSQFYESALQKMGSAGRQAGGEFYTPRPVIRFIIKIIKPKIGEKILDPFMGSGGFLAETFQYLKNQENLTAKEYEILQNQTFIGQELKPIPFLLGVMNCILHELYGAEFIRENTFSKNIRAIPPKERVDIVLTNPPFGAEIEPTLLENFPYPTRSTQVLAVQYILRKLKPSGRCGMVVDEGFLSRVNEKAFLNTKKELVEENNLFAVVSLPQGAFSAVGAGVKTNLIFFEKGKPTREIWYYELVGKFTKIKPIKDSDFEDALKKFQTRAISENSWIVKKEEIVKRNYDFSARNPNRVKSVIYRKPEELVKEVLKKEKKIEEILRKIKNIL